MKKNMKLIGVSLAVVIAFLVILTAFTSAFPAGQMLLSTEGSDDIDKIYHPVVDKGCDCLEQTNVICDYLVPGVDAIQSDPAFFDQGYSGRDITPEEYETRLNALTEYCASGVSPGSWYGADTGYGGNMNPVNAILLCFGAALVATGVTTMVIALIVTSIAIGMDII